MYWTDDYETLWEEIKRSNEAQKEIILYAYQKASNFFDSRDHEMDDFIVIRVEGYDCIALITDEFTPIEISPFVVPYNNERVFPLQCIEQKVVFTVDAD